MRSITYEQFANWCKRWNYTIDEGYKAMCFTSNIIGQYYGNCVDYEKEISHKDYHSTEFKKFVEAKKERALDLIDLYGRLDSAVFEMLEEHMKK